jgi:AcrR family transcriptional regulator
MGEDGLRARKKAETRSRIAETAARLFAARGYDDVTVVDVARAAEVAEKTVYNYFPSKESLALDRDEEEIARLIGLLRNRPAGVSPAQAVRDDALALLCSIGTIPADQIRGTIGTLAALNPGVRRSCLEMMDRHADALAEQLVREIPGRVSIALRARIRAYAAQITRIYMVIIDESGRRLAAGTEPRTVVKQLRPVIAALLDDLECVTPPCR